MATINNIMEDLVFTEVNKIYDELLLNPKSWFECGCQQCRLDTMCYVLNRIKPYYVKSSRGLAHFLKSDELDYRQLSVDITTLAIQGAEQVAKNKRPHAEGLEEVRCPVFNFPAITGRILDGKTFLPINDIEVYLKMGQTNVEQLNALWENPYIISEKTAGTYSFLPKYARATDVGVNQVFPFSIVVDAPGYAPLNYYFKVGVQSREDIKTEVSMQNYLRLPDLFLF